MSWYLKIDIPHPRYKAGDTVSGAVCLVSEYTKGQEVDVGSVTIEFTGRTSTAQHWPRLPNNIRLLSYRKTLVIGPRRLCATYHQDENDYPNRWPFSFTLPLNCSLFPRDSVAPSQYFNSDPNQPLPISFADNNIHGGSCSVVYELQATLISPLKDGYYTNEGCTKKVEILVHRPRGINQPNFRFNEKGAKFTYRSFLLLPREERELADRFLTIREKFKAKSPSTKHLPQAVFQIRVRTPSVAVIGKRLPLMLHVDFDANASTVPPPFFHLKRVSIQLCEETSIWGLKRVGEFDSTRWTKEITLQEKGFEAQKPQVEEHLDLRTVMDTTVDCALTPTLKTFNIARTYSLKVFIRLECAGKEHLVFGDYKRCTLLAEEYDSQGAGYNEPASIMDEGEIDPPPSYHSGAQEAAPEYSPQAHFTGSQEHGYAGQTGGAFVDASGSRTGAAT